MPDEAPQKNFSWRQPDKSSSNRSACFSKARFQLMNFKSFAVSSTSTGQIRPFA
jgi:hypothetical protein